LVGSCSRAISLTARPITVKSTRSSVPTFGYRDSALNLTAIECTVTVVRIN
jgi:hypothetical protein